MAQDQSFEERLRERDSEAFDGGYRMGYDKGWTDNVNVLLRAKVTHAEDCDCRSCEIVRWLTTGQAPEWVTVTEIPAQDHPAVGG